MSPAAELDLLCDILATPGLIGIDTETTIANAYGREVCTVQAAHEDGREAVVYCYGKPAIIRRIMKAVTESPATLAAHNAVFEMEVFLKYKALPKRLYCTMIAAKVLRGRLDTDETRMLWNLKSVADRELGVLLNKETRDRDWRLPLDEEAREYALEDARVARDLWIVFEAEFEDDFSSWAGFEVINDALEAIATCNLTGVPFDREAHARMCEARSEEAAAANFELHVLTEEVIRNHGSPKQVSEWLAVQISGEPKCSVWRASLLFNQWTGQSWPLTTTGFSLNKKIIESLLPVLSAGWPEVAKYLIRRAAYQKASKLVSSFGPTLAAKVDEDGNIRTSLIPHGAKTSRQSSRTPNLQNQPNAPDFRAMYKAAKGRKLVIADYSQIELRVGCIIADDKVMQAVFGDGVDIHAATFEAIQKVLTGEEVKYDSSIYAHKSGRKGGKAVTFAALYGAIATTIALNAGISLPEAEELLNAWLAVYTGVARYREEQPQKAVEQGYIQLVSGQRIAVIEQTRPTQMINAPVQGSAATVMYRALTLTHSALKESGIDAVLALNVHDEILLDAAEVDAPAAARLLTKAMKQALLDYYPEAEALGMAKIAEAAICDNWGQKDDDDFLYVDFGDDELEAA